MTGPRWLLLVTLALGGCTTEFDPALLDAHVRLDGGAIDAARIDAAGLDGATDAATMDAETPDGGPPPCPAVRLVEGTSVVEAGAAGALPPRGAFFRDPTFGTCVARVSDHGADGFPSVDPPERGTLSSDGTEAVPLTDGYRYQLYDLDARAHEMPLNIYSANQLRFAANDARELYYLEAPFTLVHTSLDSGEIERIDLAPIVTGEVSDAVSVTLHPRGTSADDAVWALSVETSAGRDRAVVVVDASTWTAIGSRTLTDAIPAAQRDVRVGVSPSGAFVVIAIAPEEVGPVVSLDVYSRDLATHRFGLAESDGATAWDLARGVDGGDELVYTRAGKLFRVDLEDGAAAPIAVLDQLDGSPLDPNRPHSDVRISGAAFDRPGWVVLSFAACRFHDGTACPDGTLWAQDKLALVSLGSPARVLSLAWHRSTQGGSRHPAPLPTRDLRRILFQSSWGSGLPAELYEIELPDAAIGAP